MIIIFGISVYCIVLFNKWDTIERYLCKLKRLILQYRFDMKCAKEPQHTLYCIGISSRRKTVELGMKLLARILSSVWSHYWLLELMAWQEARGKQALSFVTATYRYNPSGSDMHVRLRDIHPLLCDLEHRCFLQTTYERAFRILHTVFLIQQCYAKHSHNLFSVYFQWLEMKTQDIDMLRRALSR